VKSTLQPGLTGTLEYRVPAERTVPHLLPEAGEFSGMPQVLATGYLIGLVEWACIRALRGHLDDGERTVGVHVDVSHEAPTPPGCTVRFEVELTAIDRRRLSFTVLATDDASVVCRGVHQRAVINVDRFERNLTARTTNRANQPQA
jgi:fluoroacetyl-CoA thioesterase